MNLLGGLFCLAAGAAVALLNAALTRRITARKGSAGVTGVFLIRQALNLGLLSGIYFMRHLLPFSLLAMFTGAALGLTVPSLVLAVAFRRKERANGAPADEN